MSPKVLPLRDQVVLVTGQYIGSSHNLSRSIALAFARQGALGLVINGDESSDGVDDLMTQIDPYVTRVVAIKADMSNAVEVERLFVTAKRHFGYPITTVVNDSSADCSTNGNNSSTSWEVFDTQWQGTLQAVFNPTKAALPGMRECGFGRIINIQSTPTHLPSRSPHGYTIAKSALLAFTQATAAELYPFNITVNLVSGGPPRRCEVCVVAHHATAESAGHPTLPRKLATSEEMADAVLFFASPWARAVTGQSLCVDGGLY